MKKISIIIPVYNVEKYIEKCLLSCLKQDILYVDYEIIVVNDGSPDNSLAIINSIAEKYDNILLINKTNGGLSSARNAGLALATGEYIWFIDSDDWIEENCLAKILQKLDNADVLVMDAIYADESNQYTKAPVRNLEINIEYSGLDVYHSGYFYPYSAVQFYIYNRIFLLKNNLLFKEGVIYEDLLFTAKLMSLAKKCYYYNTPCYYYLIRANSITSSQVTTKHCLDLLLITDELFASERENEASNCIVYDSIARNLAVFYRYKWSLLNSNDRLTMRADFFRRSYWLKVIFSSKNCRYIIYYLLIKLNIKWRKF